MIEKDSKIMQLSWKDIKSWIVYVFIIAIGTGIPLLPDVQNYLITNGWNPILAGYVITIVTILAKKFLSDYSK